MVEVSEMENSNPPQEVGDRERIVGRCYRRRRAENDARPPTALSVGYAQKRVLKR